MTDSVIKYVGVDGCKGGWIGVGLSDDDGCPKIEVCKDFSDIVACFGDACVILVDTPIGLREDGKPRLRACDEEARWLLGEGWRSVFRVASRKFIKEAIENPDWGFEVKDVKNRYDKAKEWLNRRFVDSGSFTSQEFYIIPKMGDVDKVLSYSDESASSKVRESHPEVCFLALSEGRHPISVGKKTPLGFWQRFRVVRNYLHDVSGVDVVDVFEKVRHEYTRSQVGDDDVLDALVLAITAQIGFQDGNELRRLPKDPKAEREELSPLEFLNLPDMDPPPTDNSKKKLPMEMVYALPNDKGTPC